MPEQTTGSWCGYPPAAVNFQFRHEAEARPAVEEFAGLFGKGRGVLKDALYGAQAGMEKLSLGAPPEDETLRVARGSGECSTWMTP
jgi:hypothetical protein